MATRQNTASSLLRKIVPAITLVAVLTIIVLFGLWLVSRASSPNAATATSLSSQQAIDEIDRILRESVDNLPSGLKAVALEARPSSDECTNDKVKVKRLYRLTGGAVDYDARVERFNAVMNYWNWRDNTGAQDSVIGEIEGQNYIKFLSSREFEIIFTEDTAYNMTLAITSPCIWPSGTEQ